LGSKKELEAASAPIAQLIKSRRSYICEHKNLSMGLLTPKGKKGDKKTTTSNTKNPTGGSKFISKGTKAAGGPKKPMTGGSQRGS
jgi:hypothetical protein